MNPANILAILQVIKSATTLLQALHSGASEDEIKLKKLALADHIKQANDLWDQAGSV